jgi:hypothetical protein
MADEIEWTDEDEAAATEAWAKIAAEEDAARGETESVEEEASNASKPQ